MDDLAEALKYVFTHAEEFGVDVEDYAVAGFSAGGHPAAGISKHLWHIALQKETSRYWSVVLTWIIRLCKSEWRRQQWKEDIQKEYFR